MTDILAGVVLAAGAGRRLRPLTLLRPKALCPVADVPLVDRAVASVGAAGLPVAVNVHHGRESLEAHLAGRVHLSIEEERALGTAGALGQLRDWLSGRGALIVNADAYADADLAGFVAGWDGERVRLLLVGGGPLTPSSGIVASLLPWSEIVRLRAEPSGLFEVVWAPAQVAGRVEVVAHRGTFVDCGTPADYLRANLAASGGLSVIGSGAEILGEVERSVLWPGAVVGRGEQLVDAIRTETGLTVLVR